VGEEIPWCSCAVAGVIQEGGVNYVCRDDEEDTSVRIQERTGNKADAEQGGKRRSQSNRNSMGKPMTEGVTSRNAETEKDK
jgi:hypothetical protein